MTLNPPSVLMPFHLKIFSVLFASVTCMPHPNGQLETSVVAYLLIQFSKILACRIGSNLYLCIWRWAQVFIKTWWGHFSSSSLFIIFPQKFPVGSCFSFLHPECWGFSYFSLPCTSIAGSESGSSGRRAERNKQPSRGLAPPSCKPNSLKRRRQFVSLIVWLLQGPIAGGCEVPHRLLWAEVQGKGEWRENGISLHSLPVQSIHSRSMSQNLRLLPGVLFIRAPLLVCCVRTRVYRRENIVNSPLDWRNFKFWTCPLFCLLLFIFQNP